MGISGFSCFISFAISVPDLPRKKWSATTERDGILFEKGESLLGLS